MTTIEANKTSKDVFYTVIDGSKCEDYIKLKNRNNKEKMVNKRNNNSSISCSFDCYICWNKFNYAKIKFNTTRF